jgi:hypothetical protein
MSNNQVQVAKPPPSFSPPNQPPPPTPTQQTDQPSTQQPNQRSRTRPNQPPPPRPQQTDQPSTQQTDQPSTQQPNQRSRTRPNQPPPPPPPQRELISRIRAYNSESGPGKSSPVGAENSIYLEPNKNVISAGINDYENLNGLNEYFINLNILCNIFYLFKFKTMIF